MLKKDTRAEQEGLLNVANLMCIAARTAPKGKGIDNIITVIVTEKEKEEIARIMKSIGEKIDIQAGCKDCHPTTDRTPGSKT